MNEELKDPAFDKSFGSFEEPQGYSYKPQNPLAGLNDLRGGRVAAKTPEYLNYDIQGRGWSERTFLNVGTMYLAGITLGGGYGFFEGLNLSPSTKFNIRLNTILNRMARRGSKLGNAVGCVTLIYSLSDAFFERQLETDRLFERMISNRTFSELGTPLLAGAFTGLFYRSTSGSKTMVAATLVGAVAALGVESIRKTFSF